MVVLMMKVELRWGFSAFFLFHSCETLVQLKMLEKLRSTVRKKRHKHNFVHVHW